MNSQGVERPADDVVSFAAWIGVSSGVMLGAGLLACVEPARRALRINPIDALRDRRRRGTRRRCVSRTSRNATSLRRVKSLETCVYGESKRRSATGCAYHKRLKQQNRSLVRERADERQIQIRCRVSALWQRIHRAISDITASDDEHWARLAPRWSPRCSACPKPRNCHRIPRRG